MRRLSTALAKCVHQVDLDAAPAAAVMQIKTGLIDAIACMLAGAHTPACRIATGITSDDTGDRGATLFHNGAGASPGNAALVNGVCLRVLDLLDTYVGMDVCHPAECIPALLACAQAESRTGRALLEAILAGVTLHLQFADTIPLHRKGLHHIGHAAWVVPLTAGRLLGHGPAVTARALDLCASRLIVPEGFGRGHVANLKAFAYPLLARDAIASLSLAAQGVAASDGACEEIVGVLNERFGMEIVPAKLVPTGIAQNLSAITPKTYPAQYALQPLIATTASIHASDPSIGDRIARIVVTTSRRVIERTADPAKYRPTNAESADHSLPFALAMAIAHGNLRPFDLEARRWEEPQVARLMEAIHCQPLDDATSYAVPEQTIALQLKSGEVRSFPCVYPPGGKTWRDIAIAKLHDHARSRDHAGNIVAQIDQLESAQSIDPLIDAIVANVPAFPRETH